MRWQSRTHTVMPDPEMPACCPTGYRHCSVQFKKEKTSMMTPLHSPTTLYRPPSPTTTPCKVERKLSRSQTKWARQHQSQRTESMCGELSAAFKHPFNLSLRLKKVPKIWKTSCIVPVQSKGCPSTLTDYGPVVLSSRHEHI